MSYTVKIIDIHPVTHNVNRYVLEKPVGYTFIPGQATDVSINKDGWKENTHPFTFTSLTTDSNLEFTIKSYAQELFPNHSGMTEALLSLTVGDELIIGDPWGTISYEGKGVFIAGGAGITPFIAILRDLKMKGEIKGHRVIFSNKLEKDIIIRDELVEMFKDSPNDLIFTLTQEKVAGLEHGRVNSEFIKRYVSDITSTNFYVCGPRIMKTELIDTLKSLGAPVESLIFEQ